MAVYNAVNPCVVGGATKKDDYDRAFDNAVAIQEGNVALVKVALDGAAADPAVSASGDALIYYNITDDEVRASRNGAAFEQLSGSPLNDPTWVGGTRFLRG